MNVTCFLSVVLLFLVICAIIRESIANRKRKDQANKVKNIRKYLAGLDLPRKIGFFSKIIFAVLFTCLYITHSSFVFAIISIPGLIIYTLVLILTLATTWKVISTGGKTQLTSLEGNSLAFLGVILSVLGLARSTHFNAIYLESTASIVNVFILAFEYSAYLFFIITLAFLLISDWCRTLIWCASKLSAKYRKLEECIRKHALPHTRKCKLSVKLTTAFCTKNGRGGFVCCQCL